MWSSNAFMSSCVCVWSSNSQSSCIFHVFSTSLCEADTPSNVHLNSAPPAPSPSTPSLSQDVTIERLEERVAELESELSSKDEELREQLRLKEEELRNMHEKEAGRGNDHKVCALCLCMYILLCFLSFVFVCLFMCLFVCLCQ